MLNRRLSSEIAARKRVETNLKEAEQSLEQASKLAALGQMSAAVSHELNQPLAAMKTYLAGARLLLTRRRPDEALSSFQRIDDLIDRMGGITRQLKSYARKGDVDIEPVDLRDSVRAALAMMAPQLGKMAVQIQTTLPSEPAVVMADPLRIEQIIVNLLRNALDAVRGRDDQRINILLVAGETILLSVEDNGPGLAEPDKLFEPFYTTKKPGEGLGLGLAISAGFAAELGGRLVARNAPDGGAVFELDAAAQPRTRPGRRVRAHEREDQGRDHRRRGGHARERRAVDAALGLRARRLRGRRAGAQGARRRLPRHRHQRHPHARHRRHGAAAPAAVDRPRPAGDPDDRPRRRADGGRGDADRRLRLRREAVRARPARRALPQGRRGARAHARDPGAAPRALRRQRGDAPADGLEPDDREAARDHPRRRPGRRPRADPRRDRHRQEPDRPRDPRRRAARVQAAGRGQLRQRRRPSSSSSMLFGGPDWPEKPLVDQADGGTLCLEDVEALSPAAQVRLLDVDQRRRPRLGGDARAQLPRRRGVEPPRARRAAGAPARRPLLPPRRPRHRGAAAPLPRRGHPDAVLALHHPVRRGVRLRAADARTPSTPRTWCRRPGPATSAS